MFTGLTKIESVLRRCRWSFSTLGLETHFWAARCHWCRRTQFGSHRWVHGTFWMEAKAYSSCVSVSNEFNQLFIPVLLIKSPQRACRSTPTGWLFTLADSTCRCPGDCVPRWSCPDGSGRKRSLRTLINTVFFVWCLLLCGIGYSTWVQDGSSGIELPQLGMTNPLTKCVRRKVTNSGVWTQLSSYIRVWIQPNSLTSLFLGP